MNVLPSRHLCHSEELSLAEFGKLLCAGWRMRIAFVPEERVT
jgi:hypothetical protein